MLKLWKVAVILGTIAFVVKRAAGGYILRVCVSVCLSSHFFPIEFLLDGRSHIKFATRVSPLNYKRS
jgi:hypothetical protein